jgi:hypothetical protein
VATFAVFFWQNKLEVEANECHDNSTSNHAENAVTNGKVEVFDP